jgi:hypothetical protein
MFLRLGKGAGTIRRYTAAEIKEARARYRPQRIRILFVGESPPSNGTFFTVVAITCWSTCEMLWVASREDDDFLKSFMERGCYLDDLVLTPIDDLPELERKKRCREACADLATRIAEYKPSGIVSLLRRIGDDVEIAAIMANSKACRYVVPFPGRWDLPPEAAGRDVIPHGRVQLGEPV